MALARYSIEFTWETYLSVAQPAQPMSIYSVMFFVKKNTNFFLFISVFFKEKWVKLLRGKKSAVGIESVWRIHEIS